MLSTIFKTATLRQSAITTVSTVTSGLLGAAFFFLLARILGNQEYGQFSTAIAVMTVLSTVFDLGSSQGLVKFTRQFRDNPQKVSQITKLALVSKLSLGLLATLIFAVFAPGFATHLFHQPLLTSVFRLVGWGVLTAMLFSFVTAVAQARENFYLWGALLIGTNAVRLVFLGLLAYLAISNSFSLTVLYSLTPLLGFIIGIWFLDRRFLKAPNTLPLFPEFFRFNKWVTGFLTISAVGARLDVLLTARFLDMGKTGSYALATQMVIILPQLTSAIGAVTAPKFASFDHQTANTTYIKKTVLLTSFTSLIASLILIPLARVVIVFAGPQYQSAFIPFLILLLGMDLFLAFSPLTDSLLYFFGRPQLIFALNAGYVLVTLLAGFIFIPLFGITGSALTFLSGQLFLLCGTVFSYLRLRAQKK
jgi:O-antigen/teichoic acid export membrane protein